MNGNSCIDSVTITDGDGRTLTEETCGGSTYGKLIVGGQGISGTILPDSVISRSNVVSVIFTTSGDYARAGWQLSWFAVPPHPDIGDYFFSKSFNHVWYIVLSPSCYGRPQWRRWFPYFKRRVVPCPCLQRLLHPRPAWPTGVPQSFRCVSGETCGLWRSYSCLWVPRQMHLMGCRRHQMVPSVLSKVAMR